MQARQPELHGKTVEAAAQLVQLAIEDSGTVERLMAELAARMAAECAAVESAINAAPTAAEAAGLRAQYVRRLAALLVEGANRLAEIGGATRTRFSRLLTERLASGDHQQLDAYQSFFKFLPSQNAEAIQLMQHALRRSDSALDEALRLAMPPSCEMPGAPPPPPAPGYSRSAASGP